jgi:nicotinamidase-related amidase
MMAQQVAIQREKAVVLIMDFMTSTVNNYASDPHSVVHNAARVLAGSRQAGIPVIYIVPGGRSPEPPSQPPDIHSGVAPVRGERVLMKARTGAFSTTALEALLREQGRDTLILMGVATSGCVLSTARWAADVSYKIVVVADACSDPDPEVHRALTTIAHPKSFLHLSRLGAVITTEEFLRIIGGA